MATAFINQSHSIENQEKNMSNKDSEFLSEDEAPTRGKKRITRRFSGSSSDEETNNKKNRIAIDDNNKRNCEDIDEPEQNNSEKKSRIRTNSDDSISDTHEESSNGTEQEHTKDYFPKRDRKKKLREKLKKMMSPRQKGLSKFKGNASDKDSEDSDTETSCQKIKQKVRDNSTHISLSVCDPDDSDDNYIGNDNNVETDIGQIKLKSKATTKSHQPKQIRMSAKEAMENMQKIKSESNRMLREKEVSLPYHRPKALSLKDVISRRRPAVTSDGKTLPIKMNEEQLRHYAMLLEERQKEMIELCKSDTEEEENTIDEEEANSEKIVLNTSQSLNTNPEDLEMDPVDQNDQKNLEDVAGANDMSFDQIANENIEFIGVNKDSSECSVDDNQKNKINLTHPTNTADNENSKDDIDISSKPNNTNNSNSENQHQNNTEESQIIQLHYDSEKPDCVPKETGSNVINKNTDIVTEISENSQFSDDGTNYDDIDALIENAEILKDNEKQETNISKSRVMINTKPKLTGAPGMIINLDDEETPPKPSGVQLLKERFTFFVNLKMEEDMEKDREKKYKPGTQHIKLKQQLEEEIAEQRSIEWAKRLEEESLLKSEQNAILGDESIEDIEKIEKKLEEEEEQQKSEDESGTDEDLIEDDVDMSDKPQIRNPMLEDEAEESEDGAFDEVKDDKDDDEIEQPIETFEDDDDVGDNDSSDESSSESEDEMDELKPKKSRILKAFEDSDEEDNEVDKVNEVEKGGETEKVEEISSDNKESQDDELQLAQANKSLSEDLFPSQESSSTVVILNKNSAEVTSGELGTFSILSASKNQENNIDEDIPDKLSIICETQPSQANFDEIAGMCSGSFSQNFVPTQVDKSQLSPSQELGDDVAALCTGKFYDNPFVSQINGPTQTTLTNVQETVTLNENDVLPLTSSLLPIVNENKTRENDIILKSILDELDDPQYDKPKQNKFFPNSKDPEREPVKKRFIIDSDDETPEAPPIEDIKKKKKHKKRKLEERALQISDDEEENVTSNDESDIEDDAIEKVYEYDSEENEVEVQEKPQKKKRIGDFFENEAELTSEDEWAGSGDEDEAGLDRMEREEGDDEVFHQGKLQRELGQIHMREVLDQDKREVRLIQELLFEDADLGDGHRQRKFRWRNNDGEEETGTIVDEFGDTQEDEFESEEQWRKQRHEREMFLRKMQESDTEDVNTSINRTTIIKANLTSRTMSNLIAEVEQKPVEKENIVVPEKKTTKDIPSPKKPFAIFKQNYHGSLLTRGRGALARLAALATPLAGDDDAPTALASARGNFVFAALGDDEHKVIPQKRKAEGPIHTPKLIKKMKTETTKKTIYLFQDKLFPYAEENVKQFLNSQWDNDDVKEAVIALRKLALEDQEKSVEGVVAIPGEDASKEDQIEGLVNNVKWQMSSDRKVGALKQLQGLIWKQGYDKGDIKGHVYDDVMPALDQWHSVDGQKVYIYSSGSVQAQKLLFGQSLSGDLLKFIDGHFDTAVGAKQEASSYKAIIEKIGCNADDILFLTDIVKEAEAAREAGLHVALVSREGNASLPKEAVTSYPVIQSFAQLTVSNKRKTDPQDEQPAKVPKTDIPDGIKATEPSDTKEAGPEKIVEESEKMEVDDAPIEDAKNKTTEDAPVETTIEEVTDSKDVDAPVCDIEPIVSEANLDKAENGEKMETEIVNGSNEAVKSNVDEVAKEKIDTKELKEEKVPMETADVPKDQSEVKKDNGPVAEETPPTVITEIEEITNEKEDLSEVAEIIDDLEPVVEEPASATDLEDLQNVGDELEKECNEILSKVQDVTNLDNINVKPLLNPIAEDPMEVEDEVSKDVDKLLGAEAAIESKTPEDVKPSEATNGEETKEVTCENSKSETKAEIKDPESTTTKDATAETCSQETKSATEKLDTPNETKQDKTKDAEKSEVTEKKQLDVENNKESIETSVDTTKANDVATCENEKTSETNKPDKKTESKETTVENKSESVTEEVQLNGDATNGKPEAVNQNGVENKEAEISARLSAENGKAVNGSNGDANDSEKAQGDSKVEEVSEIKVKTLAAEEPRPDPIEQATEA
ncbi:claspin-like [Zerene cesonia]|uniref:claspin-like n=1 Tax=Zerene cesonia TaxID=33412 RepID=UPI0018E4FD4E|nr:claspin-like [Zerene cesonia]